MSNRLKTTSHALATEPDQRHSNTISIMKKAFFILSFSTFSGAGLTFLTQVLLARALPQNEFGALSTALSLVMLIAPLGGFGVGGLMLKIFGEEGWGGKRWLRPITNFTFLSCTFSLIVYGSILLFIRDELTYRIIPILGLVVIAQAAIEYTSAIFQLEEKYQSMALFQLAPHLIRFLLIILFIYSNKISLLTASEIYLFAGIITILFSAPTIKRVMQGNLEPSGHKKNPLPLLNKERPTTAKILKKAMPFGIAGFLYLIYFKSTIVLSQSIIGNNAAAQYSVALTIIAGMHLLPTIIYQKLLLASIHRWSNHDTEKLKTAYRYGNIIMAIIGTVIAIFLITTASPVITFLFGKTYSSTSEILKIMALSLPLTFIANNLGAILTTQNSIIPKIYCMGMAAIICLATGFIFISKYGVMGAAYTYTLIEIFLCGAYFFLIKKNHAFLNLK